MPIVPLGVEVRGGSYFGAVKRQRGSSAIMKGSPGHDPTAATHKSSRRRLCVPRDDEFVPRNVAI